MYYAIYKHIKESDVAAFKTEQERDAWVNFKDPFSKALGVNEENCTFERMPIDTEEAELRIKGMMRRRDEFNAGQEWYIHH